jgi:hypothetical protein
MTAVGPDATYSNVTREWLVDELQRMKALAHSRGDEIVQLRSLIGDLNAERVTMALKYDKLRTAVSAFSKAVSMPDGPSLAVQQHEPSWAAWKQLCGVKP